MAKRIPFHAVILAGGGGERFWPLSTDARPKQFLSLFGGKTLLRQAVERLAGLVPPDAIHVVTGKRYVALTRRELPELPRGNVVGEPLRRDTGAAVATACALVERVAGAEGVVAILTADQLMTDRAAFRRILADAARAAAQTDALVTLGVEPTYPATGFGYIRCGADAALKSKTPFCRVEAFVEKPDVATARRYLAEGRYMWNAGMFVGRVATFKAAFAAHAPALAELEEDLAAPGAAVSRVLAARYPALPRISFDYAVMEKARHVLVSRGAFGWDDVGTWASVERHFAQDAAGNVALGGVTFLDAKNVVAVAQGGPQVAVFGVEDLVVVATPARVLVTRKDRAPELKKLVAAVQAGEVK